LLGAVDGMVGWIRVIDHEYDVRATIIKILEALKLPVVRLTYSLLGIICTYKYAFIRILMYIFEESRFICLST